MILPDCHLVQPGVRLKEVILLPPPEGGVGYLWDTFDPDLGKGLDFHPEGSA